MLNATGTVTLLEVKHGSADVMRFYTLAIGKKPEATPALARRPLRRRRRFRSA